MTTISDDWQFHMLISLILSKELLEVFWEAIKVLVIGKVAFKNFGLHLHLLSVVCHWRSLQVSCMLGRGHGCLSGVGIDTCKSVIATRF